MESRMLHTFTVEGKGHFPIDMLRYDECFPNDQNSAAAIANSQWGDGNVKIHLAAWQPKRWKPTEKRWESFLWKIIQTRVSW